MQPRHHLLPSARRRLCSAPAALRQALPPASLLAAVHAPAAAAAAAAAAAVRPGPLPEREAQQRLLLLRLRRGGGRAHGTLHRLNGCRGDILLFEHHVMIGEDDDVVPRAPMPCPLRPLQPEQKQRAAAPCGCGGMQHGPHAVHAPPAPPPPSPGSWAPTTHRRAFACDKGLIMRVLLLIHGAQRLGAIAARVVASDARAATLLPRRRACMVHGLHGRGSRSIGGPCVSQAYNAQGRPAGWEARARASEHAPEFAASSCTPDGTAARVCSTRARCARSAQS